ncbi:MAG: hypothetical protein FJZ13_05235 [Candidatus Omnitrophica bacterium]|nr:hypothetical protein [Candidatus Omnitrophota bacterium]
MKQIVALPSFLRCVKKLAPLEKVRLAESLERFNAFVVTGSAPPGLGFKKINHDKYEFRVGLRLRVVLKLEAATYYLILVGNHDEIRRYLRKYR